MSSETIRKRRCALVRQSRGAWTARRLRVVMPRILFFALLLGAALILVPFWPWLVLAIWIGVLCRRTLSPLERLAGWRQRGVAFLTVVSLTLLLVPVGFMFVSLGGDAVALIDQMKSSGRARAVFETLVSGDGSSLRTSDGIVGVIATHGERAWELLRVVARVATKAVLGLVVCVAGTYVVLVDGPRLYGWMEQYAPMSRSSFRRLAAAFMETGRALMFGVLGAGSAQALLATAAYLVLGVPRPFVLGLLTLFGSIVPAVGTAFVWGPVAVGLALIGRTEAAIGLGLFGMFAIGTVDNLARPWLTRWAELKLPGYLIMVSMFGGISLVGAQGLLLGPLVLRLAKEALVLAREDQATTDASS